MNFGTLKDALNFAMDKEKKANELYLLFRSKVKDEAARTLLKDLADQELGHVKMIQDALQGGSIEGIGAKAKGARPPGLRLHGGDRTDSRQHPPGHHGCGHADGEEGLRLLQAACLPGTRERNWRPSSPGSAGRRCATKKFWKKNTRRTSRSGCERCAAVTGASG